MAIFTHVILGSNDLDTSTGFYDAALSPLGVNNLGPLGENAVVYGVDGPEFGVTRPLNGADATHANGGTVGFKAETRAAVNAFHEAGLANGGSDEGAPGPRPFAPTAYAAYLRDPFGNKICAYCFAEE